MSDNIITEIKELKAKKAKAETAVTKFSTQLETLREQKKELVAKLLDEHGISPDQIEEYIEELRTKQASLLKEAKEKLDKINL